ncbi:lipoprotein insertase outer membrane protein LolB [Sulfuriferula sp. GW1]|uniref:lipoprotein insertase outer membrane protein LolB n=1 Tax=Sulfuriferula sp. GW1 TaxID=3345111 RepID=UPI0039B09256
MSASIFLIFGLAGCATLAPEAEAPVAAQAPRIFDLSGRIAVKYRDQSSSGSLHWQHRPDQDNISLLSPLGQTVTQITRDADGVTLIDQAHKVHHAADTETLTRDLLGWRLPLSGLSYWVVGQPAPSLPYQADRDAQQRPTLLVQDGWRVNYSAWQTVDGQGLPRKMTLQRDDLEIRLVMDQWTLKTAAQ